MVLPPFPSRQVGFVRSQKPSDGAAQEIIAERGERGALLVVFAVAVAGDTVPVIIDRLTGEVRAAQIFVAVMGASNFTYVEATWTQALADWIGAHTRALAAIDGVPRLLVPDNAKVAVIKACLYEPQVNRTYAEMAAHYGTAVLPTRPYRPRDKAKVEAAVLIIERWILARLRHQRFYSLAELNAAIGELLRRLN